jgi:GTP-binding protein EngB required for normal cell division
MNSVKKRKIIPIVGLISSGKSTFLQTLVKKDILETGVTTTTKFPCVIKDSKNFQFYHVKIDLNQDEIFIKDGEAIFEIEEIKNKIKEINKCEDDINNLFYLLECPIYSISNKNFLEENYFMDVPGLNEAKNNYVNTIFERIKNKINFYIFIFSVDDFGCGDSTKNIFKKLDENKCLKKEGNLFLLNKIDKINKEKIEEKIEDFSNFFYNTFEKDEFKINKYKNTFISISSISYLNELSLENFSSFLIFLLIKINQEFNEKETQFIYILKKSVDNIIKNDEKLKSQTLNFVKKISETQKKSILNEIEKYNYSIKNQINDNSIINSNIDMNKKDHKETIYKLFFLNDKKKFPIQNSKTYFELKEFFNNKNLIKKNSINKIEVKKDNNELLEKLSKFISESISPKIFKEAKEKILKNIFNEFQAIKNYLSNEKLRISFIGSISVGKSSIINCLIGEEINPTNSNECTYRGVIYRYENSDEYKLYKTELKTIGEGFLQYLKFFDDEKPYCEGIKNIKDFLNNKNKDKNLTNEDSFIVITGRIKIFDLLNFSDELKNKIEIIDLPGFNREENLFTKPPENNNLSYYEQMSFYEKILCFNNICVFINKPEFLDDEINVEKIKKQYSLNKDKIHYENVKNFNKTCLFIINKFQKEIKEEEKLKEKFEKIIKAEDENINNLIISCFSAKDYLKYLEFENLFKENSDENIKNIWNYFYGKYQKKFFQNFTEFNQLITESNENNEYFFNIEFDDKFLEQKNDYKQKFIEIYNKMDKLPKLNEAQLNEIVSHFYYFYLKINDNNYEFNKVRNELIINFKNKIEIADDLIKKDYILFLGDFFENLEPLFEKKNYQDNGLVFESLFEFMNEIQPKIEKILKEKRESIINILDFNKNFKIKFSCLLNDSKEKKIKEFVKNIENDNIELFNLSNIEELNNESFLDSEIKELYKNYLKSFNQELLIIKKCFLFSEPVVVIYYLNSKLNDNKKKNHFLKLKSNYKKKILKIFDDEKEKFIKQLYLNLGINYLKLITPNNNEYKNKCEEFKNLKEQLYKLSSNIK